MKKRDSEQWEQFVAYGSPARRHMTELIARGEARRQARREAEERRRARLRRLTFGLLGR
jgi:hypothetical protein